jgi:hypothetical protein
MKEGRLACLKNGREGLARTACNDLLPWLLLLLLLQARLVSQHQAARHLHKQAQLSLSTTALLPRLCSLFSLCHVESPPRPNVVCLAPLSLSLDFTTTTAAALSFPCLPLLSLYSLEHLPPASTTVLKGSIPATAGRRSPSATAAAIRGFTDPPFHHRTNQQTDHIHQLHSN